jgi:hypothetical protein
MVLVYKASDILYLPCYPVLMYLLANPGSKSMAVGSLLAYGAAFGYLGYTFHPIFYVVTASAAFSAANFATA